MVSREQLNLLMNPKSIAVIGGSRNPTKIGGRLLRHLKLGGFSGPIYPINPNHDKIDSLRCFPSLKALKSTPDIALIAVSGEQAIDALRDCAQIGIQAAIVYASGFSESGSAGRKLQEQLLYEANRLHMAVCGPNSVGLISSEANVWAAFTGALEGSGVVQGHVSIVSQSGALLGSILSQAADRGIGMSYLVSSGNEAQIDAFQYMEYCVRDTSTAVVAGVIETIRSARTFWSLVQSAHDYRKPVILLKIGRSTSGQQSAMLHTGALLTDNLVYDAICKAGGIVTVDSLDDLLEISHGFVRTTTVSNSTAFIYTTSGGAAGYLADQADLSRVSLPDFSPVTKSALEEIMPPFATINNPLDTTGQIVNDHTLVKRSLHAVLQDPSGSPVVIGAVLGGGPRVAEWVAEIVDLINSTSQYVAIWWPGGAFADPYLERGRQEVAKQQIPIFVNGRNPFRSIHWLFKLRDFWQNEFGRFQEPVEDLFRRHPLVVFNEPKTKFLLEKTGVPVIHDVVTTNHDEAIRAAHEIGFPIVLKIVSSEIVHKNLHGGVKLGISNDQQLTEDYDKIVKRVREQNPHANIEGMLVEPMILGELECFIGINSDPIFGPIVLFGLGGPLTEIIKDITGRPAPLTTVDIDDMLKDLTISSLFVDTPDCPSHFDIVALRTTLKLIGDMAWKYRTQLHSLDINPLFVMRKNHGVLVGDAVSVWAGEATDN